MLNTYIKYCNFDNLPNHSIVIFKQLSTCDRCMTHMLWLRRVIAMIEFVRLYTFSLWEWSAEWMISSLITHSSQNTHLLWNYRQANSLYRLVSELLFTLGARYEYRTRKICSLRKKFFRSQAQRAGNKQILDARKKLHKPELFFAKAWSVWKFLYDEFARDVFYSGTHLCLWLKGSAHLPLFTFKERNSGLFCLIFLKFTVDNFTSPVGLAILKFYSPGPNFTSLGHRTCTIFQRLNLKPIIENFHD